MSGLPDQLALEGESLEDVDFSGRRTDDLSVAGSTLIRCNFSRIRARSGTLGVAKNHSEFVDCVFDKSRLSRISPVNAKFVRCSFRDVRISNLRAADAEFVDCVFTGSLRRVIFSAVPDEPDRVGRSCNEFRGNDFSGADLVNTDFREGIDLGLQRLPTGEDYVFVWNVPAAVIRGRAEVRRWTDPELRLDAGIHLDYMEGRAMEGQRDAFFRVSEVVKDAEAGRCLAAALTEGGRFAL